MQERKPELWIFLGPYHMPVTYEKQDVYALESTSAL